MRRLKKWKLACPISELDLIFPNENGKPMCQANMMNRHFRAALNKEGLPKMRFHDLRHTYASLLIEQGENIKYIEEPRSKLRGMFCRAAVLRSDRKEFCLI